VKNPLIFLARVEGTDCDGHYVGLTYNGRLVFPDHGSVDGVEASAALFSLAERSRHSHGCAQVLEAARQGPRWRGGRKRLRALTPTQRRAWGRAAATAPDRKTTCTPLPALLRLVEIGLLVQVPLSMWDLVRR